MAMKTKNSERRGRKKAPLRKILSLIALGLAIAAIFKELKQPKADRNWNGKVLEVVPYDFRKPSLDKVRDRMWNPEGPLINPRVFGVGWTINLGGAAARLKKTAAASATRT